MRTAGRPSHKYMSYDHGLLCHIFWNTHGLLFNTMKRPNESTAEAFATSKKIAGRIFEHERRHIIISSHHRHHYHHATAKSTHSPGRRHGGDERQREMDFSTP
jgi:hypothetical protein